MFFVATLLVALTGCSEPEEVGPAQNGSLSVCLGGPEADFTQDADNEISGTVTSIDDATADVFNLVQCGTDPSHTISIEDAGGQTWTVGISVDHVGTDTTPFFDVAEGAAVDMTFVERLVWGTVAGFTLADETGLIAAVEEGTWGGALDADQVPGLRVSRGNDLLATEETDCQPIEIYNIIFEADDDHSVSPGVVAPITIDGMDFQAHGIAAWEYGSSDRCSMSDTTNGLSWVVYR